MNSNEIYVGQFLEYLYVKIDCDLTMHNILPLRKFLNSLKIEHTSQILLDMQKVNYMDSTSLGIIASLSMKYLKTHSGKKIKIFHLNQEMEESFNNFGFEQICDILKKIEIEVDISELVKIPDSDQTIDAATILEAHEQLCEMNDKNKQLFENVVAELKKQL